EIGIGKTVENAYRYGTIEDFIQFARNQKRKSRISDVKDKEQRTILEELQFETENKQEKIEDLTEEIKSIKKELEKIKGEYDSLETQVENVYKVGKEQAE